MTTFPNVRKVLCFESDMDPMLWEPVAALAVAEVRRAVAAGFSEVFRQVVESPGWARLETALRQHCPTGIQMTLTWAEVARGLPIPEPHVR